MPRADCVAPTCPRRAYGSEDRCYGHRHGGFRLLRPSTPEATEVWVDRDFSTLGRKTETYRDDRGRIHRGDGGPAKVESDRNGWTLREEWWLEGEISRLDGPAVVEYRLDGEVREETYRVGGVVTREGGAPAVVRYDRPGIPTEETYFLDGLVSRIGGPAIVSRRPDGTAFHVEWRLLDRTFDGPAELSAHLDLLDPEWVTEALRRFGFGELLDEGAELAAIIGALGLGLGTTEGIRAILDGAPASWAFAFESGAEALR